MGTKISVDKTVSNLDDILDIGQSQLKKVKADMKANENISAHHLKIWKFYRDESKSRAVKCGPISLHNLSSSNFTFSASESYLVLLIYRNDQDHNSLTNFPVSLWGTIESYVNLTPRGLSTPLASSVEATEPSSDDKQIMEGFLLPRRSDNGQENKLEYMIFVWNGRNGSAYLRSLALSNAFDLETQLSQSRDSLLEHLFTGAVFREKKIQKGSLLQLNISTSKTLNTDMSRDFKAIKETVYLLKVLFPEENESQREQPKEGKKSILFPHFKEYFIDQKATSAISNYMEMKKPQAEAVNQPEGKGKVPQLHLSVISKPFDNQKGAKNIPNLNLKFSDKGAEAKGIQEENNAEGQRKEEAQVGQGEYSFRGGNTERRDNITNPPSQVRKNPPTIKALPLSQVHLKTREEDKKAVTYGMIEEEEGGEVNYDMRDTTRQMLKMEHFADVFSEILPEQIYVSGEAISGNKPLLLETKITHIINCAADVCANKFPEDFVYKTYYLKDSKTENIECVFYDSIFFIENALQNGGRVLIHCVQGVSRSVTICLAYIIYKMKLNHDEAFNIVKRSRGVASPNMGFTVQLLLFYKRLFEPIESFPVSPKVFCISSHQREQPDRIVPKLLIEPLYSKRNFKTLDPRGVFLIQTKKKFIIWIGADVSLTVKERYLKIAEDYIKVLQTYEKGASLVEYVEQARENPDFWKLWTIQEDSQRFVKNLEWDNWYLELELEENVQGTQRSHETHQTNESLSAKSDRRRPYIFVYPDSTNPLAVFDLEDLHDEAFIVLCNEVDGKLKAFVWKGVNAYIEEEAENSFVENSIKNYWVGASAMRNVEIIQESVNHEDEEFLEYFN